MAQSRPGADQIRMLLLQLLMVDFTDDDVNHGH